MKKTTAILTTLLCAGAAFANIAVDLKNNAGVVYQSNGSTMVDQALVQLIWTASAPVAQAGVGGALGSGEYLLYDLTTTVGYGGTWQDQNASIGILEFANADVGDAVINDGYIFVRIFDAAALTEGAPYLQQFQQNPALTQYDSQTASTVYDSNGALGGTITSQGYQIIPEPAVVSLIGLFGTGMIVSRRIFRKD